MCTCMYVRTYEHTYTYVRTNTCTYNTQNTHIHTSTFNQCLCRPNLCVALPARHVRDEGLIPRRLEHPRKPVQCQCLHMSRHHNQQLCGKTWNTLKTVKDERARVQLEELVCQGHPLVDVDVDLNTLLGLEEAELHLPCIHEFVTRVITGLRHRHESAPAIRECHPSFPGGPVQYFFGGRRVAPIGGLGGGGGFSRPTHLCVHVAVDRLGGRHAGSGTNANDITKDL